MRGGGLQRAENVSKWKLYKRAHVIEAAKRRGALSSHLGTLFVGERGFSTQQPVGNERHLLYGDNKALSSWGYEYESSSVFAVVLFMTIGKGVFYIG